MAGDDYIDKMKEVTDDLRSLGDTINSITVALALRQHARFFGEVEKAMAFLVLYQDGTLGMAAEMWWFDGTYDREFLSVNLTDYGMFPDKGCVFIPDYAQHEGVAKALEVAGMGKIKNLVAFGPHDATGFHFQVADWVLRRQGQDQ